VARPSGELNNEELGWIAAQFELMRELGATTLVAEGGRHAASMLVPERNTAPTEPAWRALNDFLYAHVPPPGRRVVIESDGWELVGDLTQPLTEGPWPAALLLHNAAGSRGEQEGIAAQLARRGIASLRLDLRGHGDSINLGRFDPDDLAGTRHTVDQAPADVQAALEALPELAAIDPARIAVVGASYTGETAAEAARAMNRYQAAYVMLSPGDFSDVSIAAIDPSGAAWLTMRCQVERPFFDDLFADIEAGSSAEIVIVPGACHGTDILAVPGVTEQIADWIAARLGAR
jgi:dienelactone hydrolase